MNHLQLFSYWFVIYLVFIINISDISAQDTNQVNKFEIAGVYFNDDTLLIKNANLIGRTDDLQVNLLIIGGKLTVVTKDNIPPKLSTTALDAENGFLMGKLVIGAEPSFIILSDNPRENFEVILNSAKYVKFAMNYGHIILNKLPVITNTPDKSDFEFSSWTSYNPPPIAVPISYYDSRKWNKFDTDIISGLFNGIVALDRLRWVTQDSASNSQLGNLSSSSIGVIRGLRFGLVGTINFDKPWIYTIFLATAAFDKGYDPTVKSGITLYDARLDIPLPRFLTLSIGKQKEPISLERLTLLLFLPNQERSAVNDAFIPSRNWGIVLNGNLFYARSSWAIGVFNNWIDEKQSFENTSSQLTARITGIPLVSRDESNLLHLGGSFRYSNAKQDLRGRTEAEFYEAPVFVDTDLFPGDDLYMYELETYWRKAQYLLGIEYFGAKVAAPDLGNPGFYGFSITGSWIITGEMRQYRKRNGIFGPVPVSTSIDQGGWGALETAIRYSSIDLNDGCIQGGKMDTYSFALNWWLTPLFSFSLNYRYVILDRFNITGASSGFNLRLALFLE